MVAHAVHQAIIFIVQEGRALFTITVVTITWIINVYNLGKWTATDHVITLTPLLIAAGYNIIQERNDRKQDGSTDKID